MKDQFGREINYARISVTDLCNLRCLYCMPEKGIEKKTYDDILRVEEIVKIAEALAELGIKKIRLTGGEPLVRNGILEMTEKIGKIEGIEAMAVTTNGILLSEFASGLKRTGVKRVNISLDSLKPDRFEKITRWGRLQDALDGIEAAFENGLKVRINTVLINGFNTDEIEDFVNLTKDRDIDVRFIELMRIGSNSEFSSGKYCSNDYVLERIPSLIPLEKYELSSPAVYFRLPESVGRVGLISPMSCKFCTSCSRIRITADGKLKTCLHSDDEIDLRPYIYKREELKKAIEKAVLEKPYEHKLNDGIFVERDMNRIGG